MTRRPAPQKPNKTSTRRSSSHNLWVITLDGPAGAGKSTIAKQVASKLKYRYMDSGALYRSVALEALEQGLKPTATRPLISLARQADIQFHRRRGQDHVFINDRDVTGRIRTEEVSHMASQLAAIGGVREALLKVQRKLGEKGKVVVEGRDMGTRVFPEAACKFYLDASPLERARRRHKELKAKGHPVRLKDILTAIRRRDHQDTTRRSSPLKPAPDAVHVNTTRLTQNQVTQAIVREVRRRQRSH